jgi:hypothetical protein
LNWPQCESEAQWKAPEEKAEISGKIENLNAERSLRERNLPEHLGFEPPLGILAWNKGI